MFIELIGVSISLDLMGVRKCFCVWHTKVKCEVEKKEKKRRLVAFGGIGGQLFSLMGNITKHHV